MFKSWSKTPPSREDLDKSYNGYFWLKSTYKEEDWEDFVLIEPVQLMFLSSDKNGVDYPWDKMPIVFDCGPNSYNLSKPEDIERFKDYEWQAIEPPVL